MIRILALVASAVGYWYVGSGHCDLSVSWSWQVNLATWVMTFLYVSVLYKNIFKNKIFNGVWSIVGLVYTSIYWFTFVWNDKYLFKCKGPTAILIGGVTMFSLFIINAILDWIDFCSSEDKQNIVGESSD